MGRVTKEMLLQDLSGSVFGRLTVLKKLPKIPYKEIKYLCRCECGKIKNVTTFQLRSGKTKSCGCWKDENTVRRSTKHGNKTRQNASPEYIAWVQMIQRCYNPNHPSYHNYGARGIRVCDRWHYSFENFLSDVGKRPSSKHSADRYPNNDGDYEPDNFRWATRPQQSRNQRTNRQLEYKGRVMITADWAKLLKVQRSSIEYHLNRKTSFNSIVEHYVNKNQIIL